MEPLDPEPAALAAWLDAGTVPPAIERFVPRHARDTGLLAEPRRVAQVAAALDAVAAWATTALFVLAARPGVGTGEALLAFAAAHRHPRDTFRALRAAGPRLLAACRALAQGDDPGGQRAALLRLADHDDPGTRWPALLVRAGLPPWHAGAVAARAERTGEAWTRRWLDMQGRRPPRWARVVDTRRVAAARGALGDEGLVVVDRVANALAVRADAALGRSRVVRDGTVEVQSLTSQWLGDAVPLRAGARVWVPHGSSAELVTQLRARLGGRGELWVTDPAPPRLAALRRRLSRSGLPGVATALWDGRGPPRGLGHEPFHAVVLDPPCSGSGLWRQVPDARLRARPGDGGAWVPRLTVALDAAADVTAEGGVVVFAPASVWVEEGEACLDHFLAHHPGWSLESCRVVGAPEYDADTRVLAVLRRAG